ncbi:MAG: BMC domain-containing protein [Planctomycetaceae bacterium]|jgi:microcompartment protein CcmL/EutN|nr:BMC domain-containing protein [Planctomycetaceae bacterium]
MTANKVKSVGVIELSSIAKGYKVQDAMLKSASIDILIARTICSGKYLIVFSGSVSDAETALAAGIVAGEGAVIDSILSANPYEGIFPALSQSVVLPADWTGALGVIETFSGVSAVAAADVAGKAAGVTLFRLHLAMALGGKGLLLMTGSVSDVTTAVAAAAAEVRKRGLLVDELVIPRPGRELFADYL